MSIQQQATYPWDFCFCLHFHLVRSSSHITMAEKGLVSARCMGLMTSRTSLRTGQFSWYKHPVLALRGLWRNFKQWNWYLSVTKWSQSTEMLCLGCTPLFFSIIMSVSIGWRMSRQVSYTMMRKWNKMASLFCKHDPSSSLKPDIWDLLLYCKYLRHAPRDYISIYVGCNIYSEQ